MSTEITITELPKELVEIANSQPMLAKDKAQEHLAAFAPYMSQLTEYAQEMEAINFNDPTDVDAAQARSIRLKLAKNRTASDKEREGRKASILAEGNLIQAAYNLIANASKMHEESLAQVEKFQELREKQRIEKLTQERTEMVSQYVNAVPDGIGTMTEEVFNAFLSGCKKQYEDRMEAERLQKEAEAEAERIRKLNEERGKAIRPLWNFLTNEEAELSLGEMTDQQFQELSNVLTERKAEHDAKMEEQRIENERLKAEADRKEAEAKAERDRIEAEAKKERDAMEAKLKAEREERERLEAEAKAKAAQEAREKAEAEAKAAAEEKARKQAERKAKNAPDKVKIQTWIDAMKAVEQPVLKGEDAQQAFMRIQRAISDILSQAQTEVNDL